MKTWGILMLIVGAALGFGLPLLEGILGWNSAVINVVKIVGIVVFFVGVSMLLSARKKASAD